MNGKGNRGATDLPHAGVFGVPIPEDAASPVLPHAGILGVPSSLPDAPDPRIPHPGILGDAFAARTPPARVGPATAMPAKDLRPRLTPRGAEALVRIHQALVKSQRMLKRYEADNVRLARENVGLRAALKKTFDISVDSPVFKGGGLAGRTAIEKYRGNTGQLVQIMNEVGNRSLLYGKDAAKFFLRGLVKLDIETLWAAAPATYEEGERRDDLRRKLTVEEELELLAGTDETSERARQNFISAFAGSGVDTSAQEIFRRSGEMPAGKEPRPDGPDDD